MDRLRNYNEIVPEKRVTRDELHAMANRIEEQIEEIAVEKQQNICLFECVYCGMTSDYLVDLKQHVVGRSECGGRYWAFNVGLGLLSMISSTRRKYLGLVILATSLGQTLSIMVIKFMRLEKISDQIPVRMVN